MAQPPSGKKTIGLAEWKEVLDNVTVDTGILDRMVIEYFITEGYKEVADKFAGELGEPVAYDQDSLQLRSNVSHSYFF